MKILSCEVIPAIPSAPFSRVVSDSLYMLGYLKSNVPGINRRLVFAGPNDFLFLGTFGKSCWMLKKNPRSPDNSDSSPAVSAKHGYFLVSHVCEMLPPCFPRC